jgi:hypothetical protein
VTGHPDGGDLDGLRVELQRTADISDRTEQMLEIAGIVDAALRPIEIRPIVVGGLAVAYWTTGLYLTGDIDVVMPHSSQIEERLAALGFERDGRFWTLPGRDPVFEARVRLSSSIRTVTLRLSWRAVGRSGSSKSRKCFSSAWPSS